MSEMKGITKPALTRLARKAGVKSMSENCINVLQKILYSKIVMYFHENQLTYPWSPEDTDTTNNRDLHYAFINYTSSLISDYNYFNSQYHYDSYFDGLKKYLNKMPDFQNKKL